MRPRRLRLYEKIDILLGVGLSLFLIIHKLI